MEIYVVQRGDTLYQVSRRFGVPVPLLAEINGLRDPDRLIPGEALLILVPAETYTVQRGDTLSSIAEMYGITVKDLWRNNPRLMGGDLIYPGDTLVIRYQGEQGHPLYVTGYAYPQIERGLLMQTLPYLSSVQVFTYGFDDKGGLLPTPGENILLEAGEKQVDAFLVLAPLNLGGGFDNRLIRTVFSDDAKTERLTGELVAEAEAKGFRGISLDLEYVPKEYAAAYVRFAMGLKEMLRQRGMELMIALSPKTSDEQPGLLYEGIDYRGLGDAADYAFIMTYEWGYSYGPPMAVAPLPEVRKVMEYAISRIPKEKLLMGIPNYGYDWTLPYEQGRPARSLGNQEAVELAIRYGSEIRYDDTAESPNFSYTTPGGEEHVVWFEDARSIRAKLDLVRELGIRGVGYWNLMRPFVPNWMWLTTHFEIE